MKDISLVLKFIPLGFSALLPVINPIGSAVLFLGLVPYADHATMKELARKIAVNTILFLAIVQISGGYVLRFFGISLPVVQVAGGFVLAVMGWTLLNKPDPESNTAAPAATSAENVQDKVFYPLTFPITAGPGCIVVALTLAAHASKSSLIESAFAHLGLLIGTVLIGVVVYFSYAYADRTKAKLSPGVTQGILRVISFILLCIGGEIMWNGIQNLLRTLS
ncbi:MAG TPA: MarC family protein [Candidatus Limnocylindrales bacterium]|nr:MarC family protein [Candidatus Limnocylindrales bacterium]